MTALVKNGALSDDTFVLIGAHDDLPSGGDVMVTLDRWCADRDQLTQREGRLGVRLKSDEPPLLIAQDLEHFAVVALEFPTFRDGRAYSYARLLREQHGYRGEIRAVGDVLLEQLHFMARVGFDAFELASTNPEHDFEIAQADFSVWYQPGADQRDTAVERRHN
ncbi:MAG: DUF934 domain-containing protein [Gammaproteobacteria bacterium]|nr:DUF934 domain-containing protein [Gammaproteobacteria bacterium]